jgi:hypothetical protein
MTTTESAARPKTGGTGKWATRYEDLRRQVLEEPAGSGWGRCLFVTRGLLGWMEAWPPDNDHGPSAGVPAAQTAVERPSPPSGLHREMTRVLVNMILNTKEIQT